MKLSSPDYMGMDEKQARDDFRKRLENYERAYQTLGEDDEEDGIQYCKLINVGKKVSECFKTRLPALNLLTEHSSDMPSWTADLILIDTPPRSLHTTFKDTLPGSASFT